MHFQVEENGAQWAIVKVSYFFVEKLEINLRETISVNI